jgi:hypothetical protein
MCSTYLRLIVWTALFGALVTAAPVRAGETMKPVQLKSLEALVGDWLYEGNGLTVEVSHKWILNKNFLATEATITNHQEDGAKTEVREITGQDPVTGQLVTWSFQSDGTRSRSNWYQQDKDWIRMKAGANKGGNELVATHVVRVTEDGNWTFQIQSRTVGGEYEGDMDEPITFQPADK